MKDHIIAAVVNDLRDTAIKFHDTQQLRERLRCCIEPLLSATTPADCSGTPASCPDNEGYGCACSAAAPQVVADERAAFEAWAENSGITLEQVMQDFTICLDDYWGFKAYQAGRAASPVQAQEPVADGKTINNGKNQPIIGKLMDEISALPVLWGLNEPGALLRNSDVFRVLAAAGRKQAAIEAVQIQSQSPFMYGIKGPDGKAHIDENCVGYDCADLFDEVNALNSLNEFPDAVYIVVPLYRAPVQPVTVPDGWKLVPIEPTEAMILAPGALRTDGKVARIHRDIWNRMLAAVPAAPAAQGDAWLEKCEALIDIWDDGNKPEDERAYFSGAFPEMLEEIRAAIAAKAAS